MRIAHIGWNLGGLILPLGVAALTVPDLIETLGHERFGLLALAWGLIGYAGALDLGLGRALTQMVSRLRGAGDLAAIPDVLATASRITLITGVTGGVLIAVAALFGAGKALNTFTTPAPELTASILLLAVALPAQAMSATYRGLNEAYLNFRGISLLRAAMGVINFGGPYAVSLYTQELPWIIATLVLSRLAALYSYRRLAATCLRRDPATQSRANYSSRIGKSLFSFGAWVTVSSVISPMLLQADRFIIAATVSAAAVSVYVVPYEVVVQSLILVGAVSSVIFPGLSRLMQEKPLEWRPYFNKWLLRVGVLMAVVCTSLALILPHLLPFWIQHNLDPASILIGQILCIGVFANSIGSMYYAALHAQGRAALTAKLHMIELPLFVGMLMVCLEAFGLMGAAIAWVARMIFDTCILGYKASHLRD